MAKITITNVGFALAPSVAQTCTVSYRLTSLPDDPGNYSIVSSSVVVNADGSLAAPLNITGLLNDTSYTVKVVNNCGGDGAQQEYTTPPPTCPAGYTLSPDHTYCYREVTTDPTIETSDICLAPSVENTYTLVAMKLWSAMNYNIDLSDSNFTQYTNSFWIGSPAGQTFGAPNPPASAMNRDSVWVDTDCDGTKDPLAPGSRLQFTFLITSPEAKTVFIGAAADNRFEVRVNDTLIARRISPADTANFTVFYIFPVNLISGPNYINFQAIGDGSVNDAAAIIVLDNTAAEIAAASLMTDLNFLFRTFDYIGEHIDIATCPAGYVLDTSGGQGNYICRKIETTSPTP